MWSLSTGMGTWLSKDLTPYVGLQSKHFAVKTFGGL